MRNAADDIAGLYFIALLNHDIVETAIDRYIFAVAHKHKGKIALTDNRHHPAVEDATRLGTALALEHYATVVYLHGAFACHTLLGAEGGNNVVCACDGHGQFTLVLRKCARHLLYLFGFGRHGGLYGRFRALLGCFCGGSGLFPCRPLASLLRLYFALYGTLYVAVQFVQFLTLRGKFPFHLARLLFEFLYKGALLLLEQLQCLALVLLLLERHFFGNHSAVEHCLLGIKGGYSLFEFLTLEFICLHILACIAVSAQH